VPFAPAAGAGRHALVLGATGSGKTTTLALMLGRAIAAGAGAAVIDPKGDPALRRAVRAAAEGAGRELLEWTPQGPTAYNPYARGGETEIADKVLAGERFTEPHYLRQGQRYVGHAVRALRAAGEEVTLPRLAELLDPPALERLARDLPAQHGARCEAYLDSLTARQRTDLAGVRDRLAILAESDAGPWLASSAGAPRLDLLAAARSRSVAYFALQADTRPLLSEMIGAAIVQDLLTVVASLQERPLPLVLAFDEFSAVAAERVVRLFARARSAGVSLLLATQELADLRPQGRERMLEQVMGNLSLLIAHRQAVPASARMVAELAGMRDAHRLTWHSDGRRSATAVREPAIGAEEVMALAPGWALVVAMESGVRCGVVRIAAGPRGEQPGRP
jgi:energy-coupling factor transporter ATP-binding protein EcfA2